MALAIGTTNATSLVNNMVCRDNCRMNFLDVVNADIERPSFGNEQRTRLIYDALCKVGDVHILDVRQQGVRRKGDPKMAVKWIVFALIIALLIFRARLFAHVQDGVKVGNLRRIGVYAAVLKGVAIGEGAVVVADAFVTNDVEPYAIVGGVPARIIGERVHGLDYNCRLPEWFV